MSQQQAEIDLNNLDSLIYDTSFALTDTDLLNWARQNGMPDIKIVDLKNLSESNMSRQSFIFTGAKDDEYNKNNDHHWLAHDGNLIFDSYGAQGQYKLPNNFEFFQSNPKRLQEFNTSVCGAYCCAFFNFLNNNINSQQEDLTLSELGDLFSQEYGFGTNRVENDKSIIAWYISTGGRFSNPQPIKPDTSGEEKSSSSTKESESSDKTGGIYIEQSITPIPRPTSAATAAAAETN